MCSRWNFISRRRWTQNTSADLCSRSSVCFYRFGLIMSISRNRPWRRSSFWQPCSRCSGQIFFVAFCYIVSHIGAVFGYTVSCLLWVNLVEQFSEALVFNAQVALSTVTVYRRQSRVSDRRRFLAECLQRTFLLSTRISANFNQLSTVDTNELKWVTSLW